MSDATQPHVPLTGGRKNLVRAGGEGRATDPSRFVTPESTDQRTAVLPGRFIPPRTPVT